MTMPSRSTIRLVFRIQSAIGAGILLLIGVATVLLTAAAAINLHIPLLAWDEWHLTPELQSYASGAYHLSFLIQQHNEHRILLSKILYFVDYLCFSFRGLFIIISIFFIQLINCFIILYIMFKTVSRAIYRILLSGFIVSMMFSLRQEQNFTNGFQVCFMGVFAATAFGILAYVGGLERLRADGKQPWVWFAWAALGCILSTYTMANGVLTGFVLGIIALLWRAPWRMTAITLAFSATLAWLFFRDYVPGAGPPLRQAMADPLPYVSYIVAYLGNIFATDVQTTEILGALGLLATAAATFRIATGRERQPASFMLLAVAFFIIATAVATAYGRISLGIEQALESRYATFTEIFWVVLVLYWFPIATRPDSSWTSAIFMNAIVAFLTLTAFHSEMTVRPELTARAVAFHHVSDSLLSGVYDSQAADYENVTKDEVGQYLPFLRDHHLSLFSEPISEAYGLKIFTLGPLSPFGACRGSVMAEADSTLGQAGVRLSGFVMGPASTKAPRRIVIVDKTGAVVGFGSASLPGEDPRDWTGYAKSILGDPLSAYAQLKDGTLCDLGTTQVKASGN